MSDPRNASTLGDAARNPDGTYNGANALAWLSEVFHPGKGLSADEISSIWQGARHEYAPSPLGKDQNTVMATK